MSASPNLNVPTPAQIVVVHDEQAFRDTAAESLRCFGHTVRIYPSVFAALDGLDVAPADLLITRVRFAPGQSNGLALALMARQKQRNIKILFAGEPDLPLEAEGLGEFLASPAGAAELCEAVDGLLVRLLAEKGASLC